MIKNKVESVTVDQNESYAVPTIAVDYIYNSALDEIIKIIEEKQSFLVKTLSEYNNGSYNALYELLEEIKRRKKHEI